MPDNRDMIAVFSSFQIGKSSMSSVYVYTHCLNIAHMLYIYKLDLSIYKVYITPFTGLRASPAAVAERYCTPGAGLKIEKKTDAERCCGDSG